MAIVSIQTKSGWVDLPDPSTLKVTDELVWGSNTGRTSTGRMVGDFKGFKLKFEMSWNTLDSYKMKVVRNALRNCGPFFNVKVQEWEGSMVNGNLVETAVVREKKVYLNEIPRTLYSAVEGMRVYRDIEIHLIEQ